MTSRKTTVIRTFEMTVPVTVPLEGTMDDWPAKIQDGVLAALERLAKRVKLPLKIVASRCAEDHDVEEGMPGRHYLHVIASEIVAADHREITHDRIIAELPPEIRKLLN